MACPWLNLYFSPKPVGPGRGAQAKADQGRHLSEPQASLCLTPLLPSTAGCPGAKRRDPEHRVAFLLGTFLWRRKEKCLARRGETRLVGTHDSENKVSSRQRWIPDRACPGLDPGSGMTNQG